MPNVLPTSDIVAILSSDIHLSHYPPVSRSVEQNWYEAMLRQLVELESLSMKYDAPVIYGGDVFNSWDNPAELVNFAIAHLPKGYAIPGQHDLKHHRIEDIKRTSFWTLVESGILTLLDASNPIEHGKGNKCIRLWGFPWNRKVVPLAHNNPLCLEIAVIHAYIWTQNTGYPGAPEKNRLKEWVKLLKGYDVALFGDNHTSLSYNTQRNKEDVVIFNPGGFYRRRSDEVNHYPMVGLLHFDGTIDKHYLESSDDKFIDVKQDVEIMSGGLGIVLAPFLKELSEMSDNKLDFIEAVLRFLRDCNIEQDVRGYILQAVEDES